MNANLRSIHTWRNDSSTPQSEIGPFEVKFEKPTSLVSLNLDLTFECQSTEKLIQSLKTDDGSVQVTSEEKKEESKEISKTDSQEESKEEPKKVTSEEAKEEVKEEIKTEDIKLIVTEKAPPKP